MPNATRIKALGNIRMVIYGNYGIRAATTAGRTRSAASSPMAAQNVHKDIVPVEKVSRLQGMEMTKAYEKKFLK